MPQVTYEACGKVERLADQLRTLSPASSAAVAEVLKGRKLPENQLVLLLSHLRHAHRRRKAPPGVDLQLPFAVLDWLRSQRPPQATARHYSVVLAGCAEAALWDTALRLLAEMGAQQLGPCRVSYTSTIAAQQKASRWACSLGLVAQLRRLRVALDAGASSAAAAACRAGQLWQAAVALAASPGALSDPGLRSAAAAALTKGRLWREALGALGADAVAAAPVAATTAACALAAGRRWQEALGQPRAPPWPGWAQP
eukprot:TRINITY_DN20021_c0_g1_i1.p2 TRINITY_DN20021_c0_g1~~TRINITY_DN20021_c0_g1_i1.p2  ORF type:complete len:274 (+),score=62.32 TRINITY_DN20021_c0_g1_i1:58-822(+)